MRGRILSGLALTGVGALLAVVAAINARPSDSPDKRETRDAETEARIRRIEDGFSVAVAGTDEPPSQLTLRAIMDLYKVPGLSVAVIDDYKVVWAKAYGVTEAGGNTPVTPWTLFQAGSVSKPVAAVGALRLVEEGRLSLDEDVNERLKAWKVAESEFTKDQKVTLRRVLSHTAGFTVHGFPGYAAGGPVPVLTQVLDGAKPANSPPVRVNSVPGSKWSYSGGGYLVGQQLMIDATGKRFPDLMKETVFDRLGMKDSTFEQPLPADRAPAAATGTLANGRPVPGKWHTYPEIAAAGLWTTPSDLATLAVDVARSRKGKSCRVLSKDMAREMLSPQVERVTEFTWGDEQHPDRMGLGFVLGDNGRADRFGHVGDDAGFQAILLMFGDSGKGAAVMANSDNGIQVGDLLVQRIAEEYGWKDYGTTRTHLASAVLLAVARSRGAEAAMKAYRALKEAKVADRLPDRESLISVVYWLSGEQKLPEALAVARLEAREYPDYWNAWDTLGEMYLHAGEKALAIENYAKSVALNPKNAGGVAALKQLRDGPGGRKTYVCPPCGLDCDKLTFDRPGVCPHCGMALVEKTEDRPVTVAILFFDGVQIIDYSGPWEVFGQAGFAVHTVAESSGPVKTTFGQRVLPDYTFANNPKADVLLIPGGNVSDSLLANAGLIRWIQESAKDSKHVLSVCTGAFLLAKAGLLDGQTATTFHKSVDNLARFATKTKVVYDQRFVDNGKVITTAGLSSGIDGALHLVAKVHGRDEARMTALGLEYQWDPESNYARAAFADRYLPRFQDLHGKTLSADGDADRWKKKLLVSTPNSAAAITDLLGKEVVANTPHARSPAKLLPAAKKTSADGSEIHWTFADERGRAWHGAAAAVPSADVKGKFVVTLELRRDAK